MTSETEIDDNNSWSQLSRIPERCVLASSFPATSKMYSLRQQLTTATLSTSQSLSSGYPPKSSSPSSSLPSPLAPTMLPTLKAQPLACVIANLYNTSHHNQPNFIGCLMAPNWPHIVPSVHTAAPIKRNSTSSNNCLKSYMASTMAIIIVLLQIDLCYPLLSDKPANTTTTMSGPQSIGVRQSLDAVLNSRFVRSYSEEFMTSSEERERGLQFFGGTSAGSTSSRHRIAPYFDTESLSTNVTISEGSAFVHLPCRVKQLGERTLSWIRRKDLQILTVGKFTYTSDQRFQAIHLDNSDDWSLQISYPQKKDAGTYECQVATIPKISLFVQLNVVVSKAKILESPTLYLSSGSTLNLTCVVSDTPEPPDYIFWYYNGQVINYGSPRGIKVHTEKSVQTISKLAISKVQPTDSGNYSCTPSNAEAAHIAVHIHNNANPAASIQHGKRSAREFGTNNASLNAADPDQLLITISYLLALFCVAQFQVSNNLPIIRSMLTIS